MATTLTLADVTITPDSVRENTPDVTVVRSSTPNGPVGSVLDPSEVYISPGSPLPLDSIHGAPPAVPVGEATLSQGEAALPPGEENYLPNVPVGEATLAPNEPVFTPDNPAYETEVQRSAELQRSLDAEGPGTSGNPVSRVVGSVARNLVEAINNGDPLGFNPETVDQLRDLGIFTPTDQRSDLAALNIGSDAFERTVISTAAGVDLLFRGADAIYRGATGGAIQTARELGLSKTDADSWQRQMDALLLYSAGGIGAANPETIAAATSAARARVRAGAESIGREIGQRLPASSRARMVDLSIETADSAMDAGLAASIDSKIGPTAVELAEGAVRNSLGNRVTDLVEFVVQKTMDVNITWTNLTRSGRRAGLLEDGLDPGRDFALLRGIHGQIRAMQHRGTLRWTDAGEIGFSGEGLLSVFRGVRHNMKDVVVYFAGRRARELEARGIQSGFTGQEIEAMIGLGARNNRLENAFDRYQEFNRRLLDFAQQSGLISEETLARLVDAGKDYVPFYRVMEEAGRSGRRGGGRMLHPIKGSNRPIENVMESINRNAIMWTQAAIENQTKVNGYELLERMGLIGEGGAARRLRNMPDRVRLADKEAREALQDLGLADDAGMAAAFTRQRVQGAAGPNGGYLDVIYRNGQREVYEVMDRGLVGSLSAMHPNPLHPFVRWFAGPAANLVRAGTTLHPNFIVVNMIRDTLTAAIQSRARTRAFIPFLHTATGFFDRVRKQDDYWKAMANGAGFGTFYQNEFALARNAADFYKSHGINYERQVLDTPAKIGAYFVDGVRGVGRAVEGATSVTEQASRMGEFTLLRREGANLRDAAFAARNVATDFSVHGSSDLVRNLIASVPFLNARVQGLRRMGQVVGETPVQVLTRAALTQTAPALMLYQVNKDDPTYWEHSDWIRDNHFMINIGDQNEDGEPDWLLFPKAFEWGTIFASGAERAAQAIETEHGKAYADFWVRAFQSTLAMNPTPSFMRPEMDLMFNRNFAGNPIVPPDLENVRSDLQARPWTSESLQQLARAVHEETGVSVSPMQLEHWLTGHTSTIGAQMLAYADSFTRAGAFSRGEEPAQRIDEMAVIRRFYSESPIRGTQYAQDFYDLWNESRMAAASVAYLMSELPQELTGEGSLISERENILSARMDTLNEVGRNIASMRREQRRISNLESMSGEEKLRQMNVIQRAMNDMYDGVLRGWDRDELLDRGIMPPPTASPVPEIPEENTPQSGAAPVIRSEFFAPPTNN